MKKILFYAMLYCSSAHAQYAKLLDLSGLNGSHPHGSLVSDGTFLYGMTREGGSGPCSGGCGVIFRIKPDGTGYTKLLYLTGPATGSFPEGSESTLLFAGGFLYGTATSGGASDLGTIFRLRTDGSGFMKLLNFSGASNGAHPRGSLLYDGTYLYGTTLSGGASGLGTVFRIKTDGSGYMKLLECTSANGSEPAGSLTSDGVFLYGTTMNGGANGYGTLFKIKFDGTGFAKLHDLTITDGIWPNGSLLIVGAYLFGLAAQGGTSACGAPYACGTLFRMKTDGTAFLKLYDFGSPNAGGFPFGSLINDGTFLYGMTNTGGSGGRGIIFKIKADGSGLTTLHEFSGSDGADPFGSLILIGTTLYGMTSAGGSSGLGVVFRYSLNATGIRELSVNAGFHVYPNPSNGEIGIYDLQNISYDLKIYDMLGNEVYSDKIMNRNSYTVHLARPTGIYFVELLSGSEKVVKRIAVE